MSRPGSPETPLREPNLHGRTLQALIAQRLELGRGDVSDRLEAPSIVEPVDPFERCELDLFEASPGAVAVDDLDLVSPPRPPPRETEVLATVVPVQLYFR